MNNNRNNRRRGRGNRNQGGGNSANRIDNRARGNAPQLLDKYKKLAQDAQHHGDRVQAEYYLQFADHYFRVIADNKARQDEAKAKRNEERGQSDDDSDDDDDAQDDRRNNRRRSRGRRDDRDQANGRQGQGDEGDRFEPEDNPFTKSADEGDKPKKRAPRRKKDDGVAAKANGEIDAAALPPSIGASDEGEEKPAPRRRRRKADDGDGDTLTAAS